MLPLFFAGTLLAAASSPAVLESRGYGLLIAGKRLYHRAGPHCWADPEDDAMAPYARSVRTAGKLGRTSEADGETIYPFRQIARLPRECRAPDTSDRGAVLAMADMMVAHYPGAKARGIDLAARRAALRRTLPVGATGKSAFEAAVHFLDGIEDAHLELSATIDGADLERATGEGPTLDRVHARGGEHPERDWLRAWRGGIEKRILEGKGHTVANNRLLWGRRGRVGYLAIVTMGGFDAENGDETAPLDAALNDAMAAFSGLDAIVVDVSNNRGGYDSVSRRIASRFADKPRVAMTKASFAGPRLPQPLVVEPSSRSRFTGPIYVLTSDITVSAGETFTQMMAVVPHVTRVGTTTRGAFSDQANVPLANGWHFAMPMEVYRDPDGRVLEGKGLAPNIWLDLYPARNLDHGHANAVITFIDGLNRETLHRP